MSVGAPPFPTDPYSTFPPLPSGDPNSAAQHSSLPPTGDTSLDALSGLGADDIELLIGEDDGGEEGVQELGTKEGQSAHGDLAESSDVIPLTDAQLTLLQLQIEDFITDYRPAMQERHEVEDEIRDAYMLIGNSEQGGGRAGGAQMVSGLLRRLVSQVAARLNRNFDSVTPAIVVDPVEGQFDSMVDAGLAKSTQNFLLNYFDREMGMKRLRPITILRAVKVGTAVLHLDWEERTIRTISYDEEGNTVQAEESRGGVKARLIDNRHMIVWPVNVNDWEECEWIGHYVYLSRSEWAIKSRLLGLDDETIKMVESNPGEMDASSSSEASRHSINTQMLNDRNDKQPIEIVELWANTIIPGDLSPTKFQLFYHPASKKILGPVTYNRLFSQSHPYCPIRYDWNDNFAWGTGCGHELIAYWAADTAYRNIRMDIQRATFPVILRNSGSMYNVESQSPYPGMQIPVDDPEKDFVTRSIGGKAEGLDEAIADNLNEASQTSTFAPVLQGLGDPVQKSGTGTGATLALIEQGGQRLAQIDSYLREDWGRVYRKTLELVCQFAPEGVYYQYASGQAADSVKNLQYIPPRGQISDMFRIRAMAPSASTSSETRKQNYFMLWGFATQAVQLLQGILGPMLQQSNPHGFERWNQQVAVFLQEIVKKVVEYNELPGIGELVPIAPTPTQEDQIINTLASEVQSLQQQLQQLQQQAMQMQMGGMQGMQGGGDQMMGGPPPEGGGGEGQQQPPPMMPLDVMAANQPQGGPPPPQGSPPPMGMIQ